MTDIGLKLKLRLFGALGTQIVAGHHFLGVIWVIMLVMYNILYVSDKVQLWVTNLLSLTKVAVKEPQAAYAALTKSFQDFSSAGCCRL